MTSTTALSDALLRFLALPVPGALTTVTPTGALHVAPVRFSVDAGAALARVMTVLTARKARNVLGARDPRAALCQVDGFRWLTLEGPAAVRREPERIAAGVRGYRHRYGVAPPELPGLVTIEITLDRVTWLNL